MSGSRFVIFIVVVLSVWTAMHAYVFWRLGKLAWVRSRTSPRALLITAAVLWLSYPLSRMLDAWGWHKFAWPLEFAAGNWVGTLFLFFALFLVVEVFTLGGFLLKQWSDRIRSGTAVVAGVLAVIAMVIGLLPPAVRHYQVTVPQLPPGRAEVRVVMLSDLHLGTVLRQGWCEKIVRRTQALNPDLLVIVGDLIDGNASRVESMIPTLRQFQAPLGVYAVTGNHEYYAGLEQSVKIMRTAGFVVLRDEADEAAPGLFVAGVDDLTARQQAGDGDPVTAMEAALGGTSGTTILLSHSPLGLVAAEKLGADLMLSGHTHNGQIWPFSYLVRLRYPHVYGREQRGSLTAITGAGTGTWGPRMRLWGRSEILVITLKRAA